ncbi:MAG: type II toxin-antitoxin system Phd/YefM family antitoxin [Treponema sp.]|nr:type II toxin-antitoxin system Phd/YefM family antitoxin [Treponema sp.]
MNAVPIFEAKNKLPFFIHQAEESGPVFISRRDQTVAVIVSMDDFNRMSKKRKPTIVERAQALRKQYDATLTDEEIDRIFSEARDNSVDTYDSNVFDGVFD